VSRDHRTFISQSSSPLLFKAPYMENSFYLHLKGKLQTTGRSSISTESRCHHFEQGVNKLSDRLSLLTPTLPPEEGKRRKRERDLQIEVLLITLRILLIIREVKQNIQNQY